MGLVWTCVPKGPASMRTVGRLCYLPYFAHLIISTSASLRGPGRRAKTQYVLHSSPSVLNTPTSTLPLPSPSPSSRVCIRYVRRERSREIAREICFNGVFIPRQICAVASLSRISRTRFHSFQGILLYCFLNFSSSSVVSLTNPFGGVDLISD